MYRLIPFSYVHPEEKNSLNETIIEWVQAHNTPVVFVHGWKPGCVNVGASQDSKALVDQKEAEQQGLVVVKRAGGGGTMYLSEQGEVSWMIVLSESPSDINEVYKEICGRVVNALATLGIVARHKPINDVVTDNGKISGATARKTRGVIYVGGTLLYSVDREAMWRVLYPTGVDDKGRLKESLRVTSVQEESGASKKELITALQVALTQGTYEEGLL